MRKLLALLTAAVLLGLGGCGQRPSQETPPATAQPVSSPAVAVTKNPVSTPAPAVTPLVTRTPVSPAPAESPNTTPPPAATPKPTPPAAVTPEPTGSGDVPSPAPTPTPEAPLPMPVVTPSGEAEISDEEVLAAYREAANVMSWFAGYGGDLALNYEDQVTLGDLTYCRVSRSDWNTMDELRGYLKQLFSDEIVDPLLSTGCFIETENGLYALPAGRGSDVTKGGVVLSVVRSPETPALCLVRAEVELLEWADGAVEPTVTGTQVYQFPYQKVGDKWVFTQFEAIF